MIKNYINENVDTEEIMKLSDKIYTIEEIKELIISIYKDEPHLKKIILFGSYARGEANKDSDIDLYFIYDDTVNFNNVKNIINTRMKLDNKIEIFKGIDILTCNLSKFNEISKYNFYVEYDVVKEGVVLYEQ